MNSYALSLYLVFHPLQHDQQLAGLPVHEIVLPRLSPTANPQRKIKHPVTGHVALPCRILQLSPQEVYPAVELHSLREIFRQLKDGLEGEVTLEASQEVRPGGVDVLLAVLDLSDGLEAGSMRRVHLTVHC